MITVKEAVASAVDFARNMLDPPPQDLRLEEVEVGKADRIDAWRITLCKAVSMKMRELAHA